MFHSGHRAVQTIDRVLIFASGERESQMKNKVISNGCSDFGLAFFVDRVLIEAEMCHQTLTATTTQGNHK
jgi:hypothetical protein